jgi:hypothetical protein
MAFKWTTDLGNAFLAQQSDVMDAVQRMRKKAQDGGNLKSTEQQTVETKTVDSKTVVVIQQADPQVVYVPCYNPVVVCGPPVYPYPPIYCPPPSYYAAGVAIAFGVGLAIGSYYHGGWGYNCGWGHSNVNININNNYVSHYNRNNINGGNRNNINGGNRVNNGLPGGNNNWQHNPSHRGAAPYSNRETAKQYGGSARGDSLSNRQASARQHQGQRVGGHKRALWIAAAQGWGRVTERARVAVRKRITEAGIVVVEAETILVTAKFLVTMGRETLAPSEDLRVSPGHKAVVRGVHLAGLPPVAVAQVRAVEDVGDDSTHEQGKIHEIHKSEAALHKDSRDSAWYRDALHCGNPSASAATTENIDFCRVAAATDNV